MKLLLMLACSFSAHAFVLQRTCGRGALSMSSLDYEYIPPNKMATAPFASDLASAYPSDAPAALRGEAVRSALRSGRCIAWDLTGSRLAQGWIGVSGKGTRDFLNNKFTQTFTQPFTIACLLTAKGRVIDQVCVAMESPEQAYILTSPGHSGSDLFNRLDPLIFPMDQVELEEYKPRIITLASTHLEHVEEAIRKFVLPVVDSQDWDTSKLFVSDELTALPHAVLPPCAAQGYTLILNDSRGLGEQVWQALASEANPDGAVGIGPLEYETMRIEAGLPAYGCELTGGITSMASKAPGPLELHWESLLDLEKGCYLGQEGVASVLKNPRGPPRLLYSVVFDDETNIYDHQSQDDSQQTDNLTVLPQVGQELFVLGSNEEISVGTITSVAEPAGTGESTIVGLALVRRADSILKQMKDMELDVRDTVFRERDPTMDDSGIIAPPPLDPLDGLEVIVGGTFTVGQLRMVPGRRYRLSQNMFADSQVYEPFTNPEGSVTGIIEFGEADDEDDDLEEAIKEAEKARLEAEVAAAEAKRKEEKMELLKKRAEEAMARRQKNKKH